MRCNLIHQGVIVGFVGLAALGGTVPETVAQEATPAAIGSHPFVGTWVVDTISASENDSPEIAVITPDGGVIGLGANRVAGGRWQAIDDQSVDLTLVTVFEQAGVGRYVVVRGPHTVDATGDAWTCACTFTVVGADGTVLDSGDAPASGRRLPLQGGELVGSPLAEVPLWVPMMPEGTPAP